MTPDSTGRSRQVDQILRDMVAGFLRGYTGPPETAADELIRMIRQFDDRWQTFPGSLRQRG